LVGVVLEGEQALEKAWVPGREQALERAWVPGREQAYKRLVAETISVLPILISKVCSFSST